MTSSADPGATSGASAARGPVGPTADASQPAVATGEVERVRSLEDARRWFSEHGDGSDTRPGSAGSVICVDEVAGARGVPREAAVKTLRDAEKFFAHPFPAATGQAGRVGEDDGSPRSARRIAGDEAYEAAIARGKSPEAAGDAARAAAEAFPGGDRPLPDDLYPRSGAVALTGGPISGTEKSAVTDRDRLAAMDVELTAIGDPLKWRDEPLRLVQKLREDKRQMVDLIDRQIETHMQEYRKREDKAQHELLPRMHAIKHDREKLAREMGSAG